MSLDNVLERVKIHDSSTQRYVFIVVLSIIGISWFGIFDDLSTDFINGSIFDASVAFASARFLNAVISALQTTTISTVVFSVSIGEVLDPINDLIEQYSSIMMLAIGSLIVQKLLLEIISALVFKLLITVSGFLLLYAWIRGNSFLIKPFMKIFVSLVFLRFLLVAVVLLNSAVDRIFIEPQIQQDLAVIENFPAEMEQLQQQSFVSVELQKQLEGEIERLETDRVDLSKSINLLEEQIPVLEKEIETLSTKLKDAESQLSTTERYNVFSRNENVVSIKDKLKVETDELELVQNELASIQDKIENIDANIIAAQKSLAGESSGFISGISNRISSLTQSLGEIRDKFRPSAVMASAQDFSESVVRSMTLFIFRTLILPLLFLFLLVRGIKFVWNIDLEGMYQKERAKNKNKKAESELTKETVYE